MCIFVGISKYLFNETYSAYYMPGSFHLFDFHNNPIRVIIFVLYMRKLRHRNIKHFVLDYTVSKRKSQDSNLAIWLQIPYS